MFEAFMKTLIKDGEGAMHVIRIDAETDGALTLKKDLYMSRGWAEGSKEEYEGQLAEIESRIKETVEGEESVKEAVEEVLDEEEVEDEE